MIGGFIISGNAMVKYYLLSIKERTLKVIGTHLPVIVIPDEWLQTWIEQLTARGEITSRTDDCIVFRVESKNPMTKP